MTSRSISTPAIAAFAAISFSACVASYFLGKHSNSATPASNEDLPPPAPPIKPNLLPLALEPGYVAPPLPVPIVNVLSVTRLCFLATQSEGIPHLSLMNFTYYQNEEIIIMCTRRDTKKFGQISCCPNVAILFHDFNQLASDVTQSNKESSSVLKHGTNRGSVTLNGGVRVCPSGSAEEARYKSIHLENNRDYAQFIEGDDKSVILVHISGAQLCNIQDKVVNYGYAVEPPRRM